MGTSLAPIDRLITIQQHIMETQKAHPTASGEFSWLLSGITLATKIIEDRGLGTLQRRHFAQHVDRVGQVAVVHVADTDPALVPSRPEPCLLPDHFPSI